MGVRRAGKSVLCQSLTDVEYLDCELPRTRRVLDDPESFLEERGDRAVVIDEIHRLANPAELLKIAADHFPRTRIVATGSSTLGASARFRDTLAGRKEEIWLTPMTLADMAAFGNVSLRHRLARGGLPPFFLAETSPARDFQEWMDAYWAKDILELFRLERRQSFQRLFELLLAQSGGIFEATALARPTEVSRTTVMNYLAVLEATFVMHVVTAVRGRRRGRNRGGAKGLRLRHWVRVLPSRLGRAPWRRARLTRGSIWSSTNSTRTSAARWCATGGASTGTRSTSSWRSGAVSPLRSSASGPAATSTPRVCRRSGAAMRRARTSSSRAMSNRRSRSGSARRRCASSASQDSVERLRARTAGARSEP